MPLTKFLFKQILRRRRRMTKRDKLKPKSERSDQREPQPSGKPSQAEGDRATVEHDLGEKPRDNQRREPQPSGKPSQAEGDRATVEHDLGEQKR
jgi:hypothetical protein